MICPFCEAKIEEGSIICNDCGRPIQVVPDYNPLEDDFLPEMLASTKKPTPISDANARKESNKFEYKMIVIVENGKIKVKESECPNHDCIQKGFVQNVGDVIVCLPNKVTIKVVKS